MKKMEKVKKVLDFIAVVLLIISRIVIIRNDYLRNKRDEIRSIQNTEEHEIFMKKEQIRLKELRHRVKDDTNLELVEET